MDRRRFLSLLSSGALGAAIAPTLDLDKLLWVPGRKTIFIPPATTFARPGLGFYDPVFYSRLALDALHRSLVLPQYVSRGFNDNHRRDHVLTVDIPARFEPRAR